MRMVRGLLFRTEITIAVTTIFEPVMKNMTGDWLKLEWVGLNPAQDNPATLRLSILHNDVEHDIEYCTGISSNACEGYLLNVWVPPKATVGFHARGVPVASIWRVVLSGTFYALGDDIAHELFE